jgi:DNA-binding NtrC family response regulator
MTAQNKPQRSVLVVDDNESLARTTALVLKRKGFDAHTALDGLQALDLVKERRYDAILMDIKMPTIDGVETYRRIKEVHPDALVVMMTAYSMSEKVQQALEEGAYSVLYKPLDLEKVINLIDKALGAANDAVVMVVDDQESTCTTLKNILSRRGCQVSIAHTGEEALSLVEERAYDLVLLDMKLPTIDGLETYLRIKALRPGTLVIVMTAFREEMAERVRGALDACAFSCLYKPLDVENLLQMVDRVCERKQRAHAHG